MPVVSFFSVVIACQQDDFPVFGQGQCQGSGTLIGMLGIKPDLQTGTMPANATRARRMKCLRK